MYDFINHTSYRVYQSQGKAARMCWVEKKDTQNRVDRLKINQ